MRNETSPQPEDEAPGNELEAQADGSDEAADAGDLPSNPLADTIIQLAGRANSGANWFFWIAALSLVNSAILLGGGDTFFVVGLGVTLIADSIATEIAQKTPESEVFVKGVALGFDVFVALVVIGFGWFARKGILVLFGIGMFLYLLDGLIFLLFRDFMSVGFHCFALFCMWSGFSASRQLKQLEQQIAGYGQQTSDADGSPADGYTAGG